MNVGDWGIDGVNTIDLRLKSVDNRRISVASGSSLGDGRAGLPGTSGLARTGRGDVCTIDVGRGRARFLCAPFKSMADCKLFGVRTGSDDATGGVDALLDFCLDFAGSAGGDADLLELNRKGDKVPMRRRKDFGVRDFGDWSPGEALLAVAAAKRVDASDGAKILLCLLDVLGLIGVWGLSLIDACFRWP